MYGNRYTDPDDRRRRGWAGTATAIVLVTAVAAGLAVWTVRNADDVDAVQTADRPLVTEPAVRTDNDVTVRRDDNFAAAPLARPELNNDVGGAAMPAIDQAPVWPQTPADIGLADMPPAQPITPDGGAVEGLAPAAFDRPIAPVPEALTPRTRDEEWLALDAERAADMLRAEPGDMAVAEIAPAPQGRDFEFQPLPPALEGPAGGGMVAEVMPVLPGDGAVVVGGERGPGAAEMAAAELNVAPADRTPPADLEIAAAENLGKTPEGQKLENEHDILAAEAGGHEATVKGKITKWEESTRELTLDNGDTYMLADNLKVGEGDLKAEHLTVGKDVQIVFRTDKDTKTIVSVTPWIEGGDAGGALAPAAFDQPIPGGGDAVKVAPAE